MKQRILKILKKAGLTDYVKVWKKNCMEQEIKRTGNCNEWVYMDWSMLAIHFNVVEDKIILFIDAKRIEEQK